MKLRTAIGHVLAPWPFLLFGFIALAGGALACLLLGPARGIMLGFDAAATTFLLACFPLFRRQPSEMRRSAQRNDANRVGLLLIAALVSLVVLITVAVELSHKGRPHPFDLTLVITTLCLGWLFSTMVYTLHYAHLFYTRDDNGKDTGGVCFPETKEPDYWDFAYLATCLSMTFQTSDVDITSGLYRRTVMFHCLGAFVFNLGIIAFSINILGSS